VTKVRSRTQPMGGSSQKPEKERRLRTPLDRAKKGSTTSTTRSAEKAHRKRQGEGGVRELRYLEGAPLSSRGKKSMAEHSTREQTCKLGGITRKDRREGSRYPRRSARTRTSDAREHKKPPHSSQGGRRNNFFTRRTVRQGGRHRISPMS